MSNEYGESAKALSGKKKKDKKKKNAELADDKSNDDNRDVEAAVLRYVAGTLDNNNNKGSNINKKKRKSFNNDDINEFQHWNSFLDTEKLQNGDDEQASLQQQEEPHIKSEGHKKRKKSKKKKTIEVDPELTNLDDTTDHEQLVRAAILDANKLAQDASVNIQDYIQHSNDNPELDNSIIQAAAVAQQQQEQQQQQEEEQQQQGLDQKDQHSQQQQQSVPIAIKDSKSQAQAHLEATQNQNKTSASTGITEDQERSLEQAASKASSWVRNHSTGRVFTKEEIEAIDKFLVDFCTIHSLSRKELCERIWANERKREVLWDLLHQVLPNRTRASIYKHVRRSYHIFEVRGKWTPEDDEKLARLYVEKAKQWKAIGMAMGRMPEDCRDRYRNYLKCGDNRNMNKWTVEEEEKLKEIVDLVVQEQQNAGMSVPIINWTIVSERMGGKRSRIQCRYKWNKLLKREATQRAEKLGLDDKVWLLTKIQELGQEPQKDIEWETLASLHPKGYWTGDDFKVAFTRMRTTVRDRKNKDINDVCHILLQEVIREANRHNIPVDLPVVLQHYDPKRAEDGAAPNPENIANAAINNSARANEDYVSWRQDM